MREPETYYDQSHRLARVLREQEIQAQVYVAYLRGEAAARQDVFDAAVARLALERARLRLPRLPHLTPLWVDPWTAADVAAIPAPASSPESLPAQRREPLPSSAA